MPDIKQSRSGSMQYWPRKKAKKETARVRYWSTSKDVLPLGFAGYKVGMTHAIITDNSRSHTKGDDIAIPLTVIECPPIKVIGIRFFADKNVKTQVLAEKLDKDLARKIKIPKKRNVKLESLKAEDYEDIRLLVQTQPRLTSIGKKKPEIFEMGLGGKVAEKFDYAKNNLGKELGVEDIFKEGEQIDIHSVTKSKGFQGPVKRFGIAIRRHKSEKSIRNPGSLGGWKGQGHFMYRVAHAGHTGYHLRTEYNKWLVKLGTEPKEINPKGGFIRYGLVKNKYLLLKGSIGGARKRLITLIRAVRPSPSIPKDAPSISYVSLESKQGR